MIEPRCSLRVLTLPQGLTGIVLTNPFISLTVLPEKGGDIHTLIHRKSGIDLLWKSPQGLRAPTIGRYSSDSTTAWLEGYAGGWQEILPNGGDPCHYRGVELTFHGESTTLPWTYEILDNSDAMVCVELMVRLYRSPFRLRRRMTLHAEQSALFLEENVCNWGDDPIDFMWGHHPAFGAPFLSGATRLYTSAKTIQNDESYNPLDNPYQPGARTPFPHIALKTNEHADLSTMPDASQRRDSLAYLTDFEGQPFYALVNPDLELGMGMAWSGEIFKCLWLWQEVHATRGFPWYGKAYTVALEPWSSYPGLGLNRVLETTQTQLTLKGGDSLSAKLTCTIFDAPHPQSPIHSMSLDGVVTTSVSELH